MAAAAPPGNGVSFVLVSFSPSEAWGRPFLCQKLLGMTGSMPPGVRLRPWLPQHPLVVGVWVRLRRGCLSWAVSATAPLVIGSWVIFFNVLGLSGLGLGRGCYQRSPYAALVIFLSDGASSWKHGGGHSSLGMAVSMLPWVRLRPWLGSFPMFHGGGHSPP